MDMPIFLNTRYVAGDGLNHLLTRARAMLAKALDKALEVYDITHGQGSVLWMLSTGQYATAADLARELDIDAASMTRMIDRLEKRKLMERMQRSDDRRMIKLRLTPAGLALAEKLPAVYAEVMDASLAGFGADELTHLRRLLSKLLANGAG